MPRKRFATKIFLKPMVMINYLYFSWNSFLLSARIVRIEIRYVSRDKFFRSRVPILVCFLPKLHLTCTASNSWIGFINIMRIYHGRHMLTVG